jgi:hypothetical protein
MYIYHHSFLLFNNIIPQSPPGFRNAGQEFDMTTARATAGNADKLEFARSRRRDSQPTRKIHKNTAKNR